MSRDDLVLPRKINASTPETFGRTAEEHSGDTFDVMLKVKERLQGLRADLDALEAQVGGIVTFPGFGPPVRGIGGGNSEGVSPLGARSDHDHLFRETSGPTDLGMGDILGGELVRRVGPLLMGQQIQQGYLTASQSRNVVTPGDVSPQLNFSLKAGARYGFYYFLRYDTAAVTTGLRLAIAYSGTATQLTFAIMGGTSTTAFQCFVDNAFDTLVGAAGVGPGTGDCATLFAGGITVTTAGVLALRYASGVAASNVNIFSASTGLLVQL